MGRGAGLICLKIGVNEKPMPDPFQDCRQALLKAQSPGDTTGHNPPSDLRQEYEQGWAVNEIFTVNSVGMDTARDNLAIGWSRQEVMDTVRDFASLDPETAREKYSLGEDGRDWQVALAQKDLKNSGIKEDLLVSVLYRPFDVRFTYYTGQSRGFHGRPRPEVMRHMLKGINSGLILTRKTRDEWSALVTRLIIGHNSLTAFDINYLFPLYLFPEDNGRKANFTPRFIEDFSRRLGLTFVPRGWGDLTATFGPQDVLYYIYAVFHSPTFRKRYAAFLKLDFPCLPLTGDRARFGALVAKGEELVGLHLMESKVLQNLITKFEVLGSNKVEQVRYEAASRRVYFNDRQYFNGVPPEVWAFQVGGYQVLHQWLKDRKGRALSFEDLQHYQQVVVALAETLRLMAEVDAAIPSWPLT